jgi:hypothetical protein
MIESIFAIGFSGHRELPNPGLIQQKVGELLDAIAQNTRNRLVAVCSIAIGADMIFVEACLKRKLRWIAILPMPPAMFFNEKDFPEEESRNHAMGLLEKAASVEITNPLRDGTVQDEREYRHIAFSDSGQRIVDYCDVFIGALRHTHDPLKPGGTGDVTEYAKRCHRPVAIINPDTGVIEHHRWHMPFASAFVDEIRSLPETPLREEFLSPESSREFRTVVEFFSRLAAGARRHVPRLRSMSSTAAILNGCLAVLTLALVLLPWFFAGTFGSVAKGLSVVLSILAFLATGWFILGKPHKRAARYRLGAEICRSVMATWNLPETHREIFRDLPADYRQFVRALLNLRSLERPKLAKQAANQQSSPEMWKDSISEYVKGRVGKQLAYYQREQEKARRRLHILTPLIGIFALGGLFVAAGLAVASLTGYSATGEKAEQINQLVAFSKVAFPSVVGTLITLVAAHETTRRKGRYGEMLEVLKENAERLKFAPHKQAACDVVIDNERALLGENIEWANTAKYSATV